MKIGDEVRVRSLKEIKEFFGNPATRNFKKQAPNAKYEESIFTESMYRFCEKKFKIKNIIKGKGEEYDCISLDRTGTFYFIEPWLMEYKDNNGQILLDL